MRSKDYDNWRKRYLEGYSRNQIFLPKDEFAKVISEFNTHMSDEDRSHRIVTKPIGDYYYTIINNEFNDYIVIGKHKIDDDAYDIWEDIDGE